MLTNIDLSSEMDIIDKNAFLKESKILVAIKFLSLELTFSLEMHKLMQLGLLLHRAIFNPSRKVLSYQPIYLLMHIAQCLAQSNSAQ